MYHAERDAAFSASNAVAILFGTIGTVLLAAAIPYQLGAPLVVAAMLGQLAMLVVPAVALRVTGRGVGALGIRRARLVFALAAVLLGLVLWRIELALVTVLQIPGEPPKILDHVVQDPPLAVSLLLVAILPAVCEEILFRGVLFRGLASYFRPAFAILISATVFALYHLNVGQLLPTFMLGATAAWLAHRSGSILPGMVVHAVNNSTVIVLDRAGWMPTVIASTIGVVIACVVAVTAVGGLGIATRARA